MSESSKKHQSKKSKNVVKEQSTQKQGKKEETKRPTKEGKISVKPQQDPIQDVSSNQSGDVLNITEAPNAKYKKKEIESNWTKYEMPLDTYDDGQEYDVGIDFEQLVGAPPSAGGHFQFRHERSWEEAPAPGLYHRYFDVAARDLSLALSTIPFYERNDLPLSMFDESDIREMDSKAERCKQKYYNSAPDVTDRLIAIIKSNDSSCVVDNADAQCSVNGECNVQCRVDENRVILEDTKCTEGDLVSEVTRDLTKLAGEDVKPENKDAETTSADKKTIEDSQDLEKWLDDFLDS